MEQRHATTVSVDGRGVMLCGPSGSGKSDLALRLIDDGARLIADDRTDLSLDAGRVMASPPLSIAGRMEIRGYGIVPMPFEQSVPLALVVELVDREAVERLPEPQTLEILGQALPVVALHAQDASAVAKVNVILKMLGSQDTGAR